MIRKSSETVTRASCTLKSVLLLIFIRHHDCPTKVGRGVKSARPCADVFARVIPTWPAWEIVWKLTSHAPQTGKSGPSRIPLNLSILRRGERESKPAPSFSYSRTLVTSSTRRLPVLWVFRCFFPFLLSLSQRNPWNRVTFVRNQAVVSTQGPTPRRPGLAVYLCLAFAPLPPDRQIEFIVAH